jgi:hypothetical protein
MSIDQVLITLSAFCLGLALRPYITTFRRKAWGVGSIGTGFGILLAMRNASQLSHSATIEQFKVFVFSLTGAAVIFALCIGTMWLAQRRRAI